MASAADRNGDHDSADDSEQFIKDDDSSPSPESDKPRILHPRPIAQFQSATAPKKAAAKPAAKPAPKATKSPSMTSDSSDTPGSPGSPDTPGSSSSGLFVPRRAEDWEPYKEILFDLYIKKNIILKEVIVTMEQKHNLKATPKMYKNQLARWEYFKYAIKERPRGKAKREAAAAKSAAGDDMSLLISPVFHDSNQTRSVQLGLTTVRDFLNRMISIEPLAKRDMVVVGYEDPCFRFFTASLELFGQNEHQQGGLLLRRAFLQIEILVSRMTIKGFSDLCFTIPHLLIESGRADVLAVYLRYLSELATRAGNEPVRKVAGSLIHFLDDRDAMLRFVMTLTRINSDTISAHKDAKALERTRKWAYNQYVACQRTNMPDTTAGEGDHKHAMLRVESQSVYWAQNLVMISSESNTLAEFWMRRDFPDDFAPRTEALLADARRRTEAGLLSPDYGKMMRCLYIGWLSDYYETMENWPKVFEWVRRGLEISTGEQYQVWSIHVEGLMRQHGSAEEAEELRQKRLTHGFLEEIERQIGNLTLSLG
ncbi:hypothetical protein QBC39DRAFT_260932 [Podospora conica]|nr:hypothetical protein QBC39DRAFT_260932 [Schizothecium conicum]